MKDDDKKIKNGFEDITSTPAVDDDVFGMIDDEKKDKKEFFSSLKSKPKKEQKSKKIKINIKHGYADVQLGKSYKDGEFEIDEKDFNALKTKKHITVVKE